MLGEDHDEAAGGHVEVEVPVGETTGGATNDRVPNLKLKKFGGDERKYKEWRNEMMANKRIYKVSDSVMAGLVYLALESGEGKPRDLFKDCLLYTSPSPRDS